MYSSVYSTVLVDLHFWWYFLHMTCFEPFPRSSLIWQQLIFKLFLRQNCTKSVAWPPLRAIQNVKSTIQFQSYIHDININIWTSSYMIQMLIKILLSPTSDISKLLFSSIVPNCDTFFLSNNSSWYQCDRRWHKPKSSEASRFLNNNNLARCGNLWSIYGSPRWDFQKKKLLFSTYWRQKLNL